MDVGNLDHVDQLAQADSASRNKRRAGPSSHALNLYKDIVRLTRTFESSDSRLRIEFGFGNRLGLLSSPGERIQRHACTSECVDDL
jgi:hypothetical protein